MANVSSEHSRSLWMDIGPHLSAPTLQTDETCDVVIIGAGIAGLSCAYEISRRAMTVVVIDRGEIGGGMSARTTAHLASSLDDYYSELTDIHGEETAALYYEAQSMAINRIEAICSSQAIDADFKRVDGYFFPARPEDIEDLEKEFELCVKIGAKVAWESYAPLPHSGSSGEATSSRALRFKDQARFHPAKYMAGLMQNIKDNGGRLYADTAYINHEKKDGHIVIQTQSGSYIRASHAIFTTNSPVNDKVTLHTKEAPYRTYVIAGMVPKGSVPDVLLWDTLEYYHYVRIQPANETQDYLIIGGEDHRTGEANDMDARFAALEAWARQYYPSLGEISHRWSGQVMEPIDFMPFTGRNPGDENIYVHTGDSGQGMTNGVLASLVITPLLFGERSPYAQMLEPSRKPMGLKAMEEFAAGQAGVMKNMAEHLGPSEVTSVEDIKAGSGAILRIGSLKKLAVYKDETGKISACSAICTHVGCVVHWNDFEKCWDCPCHGSQFSSDGRVLNGPAVHPLIIEHISQ